MSNEIFLKHSGLIKELLKQIEVETDQDKKFLLNAIRNILICAVWLLIISQGKEKVNYKVNGDSLDIFIDRTFAQRSFRRLLLLDAWHQFEYYFSQKKQTQTKNGKKLVDEYFAPGAEPDIIKFFRETRNALHGNGKYNHKKAVKCLIGGNKYTLSPGKNVEADWPFLLNIIEESLKII